MSYGGQANDAVSLSRRNRSPQEKSQVRLTDSIYRLSTGASLSSASLGP